MVTTSQHTQIVKQQVVQQVLATRTSIAQLMKAQELLVVTYGHMMININNSRV